MKKNVGNNKKQNIIFTVLLVIFILIGLKVNSQTKEWFDNNRMISVTIDGSRLFEDPENFDSGLDIVGTFVISRKTKIEPFMKFEVFPNIDFYKFGFGAGYKIPINKRNQDRLFEFVASVELGLIFRKNIPDHNNFVNENSGSMSGWMTYAFNGEIRYFLFQRFPFILSHNYQRRTDWKIYGENAEIKFVGSTYFGIGYIF